jgi:transposase
MHKLKRVCGLDVHKDTIFCATFDGKKRGDVKEYLTLTSSIQAMGDDLLSIGVNEIAMESTGMFWVPIWNILEDMGFALMLVNPFLIKQMPGRKSDVKDAQWIATLLHKGLLRGSLVPSKEIRELRTYSRKYMKLQQRQTSVLQEMERTLEMCSIRITSFVSKISGKSVINVVKKIIQGESVPDSLLEGIHGRIVNKHTKKTIKEALTGHVLEQHRFTLELSFQEYEMLIKQSDMCLLKMEELCQKHYKNEFDKLITLPGVDRIAALIIIAETGADMKVFEKSGKFSGWIGLRPRNDESAGKYKSTATTKGNRYLRATLVQAAWAASRKRGCYFKEKYARLAMRKPKKKALIAIARKLSVLIWNILYYDQPYNPNKLIVYSPDKLQAKINYHQKEFTRLEKILKR